MTPTAGVRRRWTYVVLIAAFLFVLMPFLFWQSTWFGRPLTEVEIEKNLAERERPRKMQHALSQIADRMIRGDRTVNRWYPQVVELAGHPSEQIRLTVAWVMGQDNSVQEFHLGLLRLLEDPSPMVQRNAALSLVRFADATGHPQILAMLRDYVVHASHSGTLEQRLKAGDMVNPGTKLAQIRVGGKEEEVRSEVPGTLERWAVATASPVKAGEEIALLAPSSEMVWEALRALALMGTPDDLPAVERYARGAPGIPQNIQQQAQLTLRSIRSRSTP